jgi:hypothetical protein
VAALLVLDLVPVLALEPALLPAGADVLPWLALTWLLGLVTVFGLPGPTAEICVWLGNVPGLSAGARGVCPRNGIIA